MLLHTTCTVADCMTRGVLVSAQWERGAGLVASTAGAACIGVCVEVLGLLLLQPVAAACVGACAAQ